jgi:hypothetical protein
VVDDSWRVLAKEAGAEREKQGLRVRDLTGNTLESLTGTDAMRMGSVAQGF